VPALDSEVENTVPIVGIHLTHRKDKQMKMKKAVLPAVLLTLALALGVASAQPDIVQTHALAHAVEAQTVGGSCAAVWGFGIALGLASLSGCGIVCGTAAWYTLLLLNNC
jgi:hypothetical protein